MNAVAKWGTRELKCMLDSMIVLRKKRGNILDDKKRVQASLADLRTIVTR
jgi:hypothetical protein